MPRPVALGWRKGIPVLCCCSSSLSCWCWVLVTAGTASWSKQVAGVNQCFCLLLCGEAVCYRRRHNQKWPLVCGPVDQVQGISTQSPHQQLSQKYKMFRSTWLCWWRVAVGCRVCRTSRLVLGGFSGCVVLSLRQAFNMATAHRPV